MESPAQPPPPDDAPYCEVHGVRGKPGEPWLGWVCPDCEATVRRAMRPGVWRGLREVISLGGWGKWLLVLLAYVAALVAAGALLAKGIMWVIGSLRS
jgi:hypothetical protein